MNLTRCRVTVCLEGWCYLFLVVFVIGSAVVRDLNVLVLLTGMMIGAFLFHWRMVINSLRQIEIKREMPLHAFAGDSVPISIVVENQKTRLPSWTVVVEDSWDRLGPAVNTPRTTKPSPVPKPKDEEGEGQDPLDGGAVETVAKKHPPTVSFPLVRGGERCCQTYRRHVSSRGQYELPTMRIWSRFPIGLLRATRKAKLNQSIYVYPRLGKLSIRWQNAIESPQFGARKQRQQRGFNEGDFYGLREWRTGDSKRWIHWRTSAKLGELTVKQFERQTDTSLAILLDLHLPKEASQDDLNQVELALRFAASAAVRFSEKSDSSHLTLTVIGDEYRNWTGSINHNMAHDILRHMAVAQPHSINHEIPHQWRTSLQRPHDSLVVISTRDNPEPTPISQFSQPLWINVRSELATLFFDPEE